MHADIIFQIALAVVLATILGFLAKWARQPLILAYIVAGIILGPTEGLGWLRAEQIESISELGLILLLFMIGLEIDLKKITASGKELLFTGVGQFLICVLLGLAFFPLVGFGITGGSLSGIYLAVAAALSSTMIVVKLLYDKFELDTIPGRITLGILIFQDIWAILFLAIQPNLRDPALSVLLFSVLKGASIVFIALGLSRYVLPALFRSVAKLPELVLIAALGWCFSMVLLASKMGLSREMGALIAGISLSAYPYSLDVTAKIVTLRDFFITLFFVTLGTKIPRPSPDLLLTSLMVSGFLVASRLLSITPILHALKMGNRISIVPALNLSQISEFSLVICAIGISLGHIGEDVLSVVVITLVITSVLSTYLIQYNYQVFQFLQPMLRRIGLRDIEEGGEAPEPAGARPIFFLGFSRYASSLLHEILEREPSSAQQITVVDFNPQVKRELDQRGIHCVYGDISHQNTLSHAHIEDAKVAICTIPDSILKGTTNKRLVHHVRSLSPHAKVIVTAEFFYGARELYEEGADFVFVPRLMSIRELTDVLTAALRGELEEKRARAAVEIAVRERMEVLP